MAELQIIATAEQGQLSFNKEELKEVVTRELKKYEIEVTEDNLKEATESRTTLNKVSKALDEKRKEIKKKYCEPLDVFENDVKEIKALIDNGSNNINVQIKAFDEKEKQDKQMEIAEYYISKNFDLVSLEKVFDPKWLNKTCKDWDKQIDKLIDTINEELSLIDSFGLSELEKQEVKGYYLDCLNITQARSQFDAQKERRETLLKRQEELRQEQSSNVQETPSTEPLQEEVVKEVQDVKKERIVVEFVATREFLDDMNVAIKKHKPQVRIIEREDI